MSQRAIIIAPNAVNDNTPFQDTGLRTNDGKAVCKVYLNEHPDQANVGIPWEQVKVAHPYLLEINKE